MKLTTRYGSLTDIIGPRATGRRFTFCPAIVTLDGNYFTSELGLGDTINDLSLSGPPDDIGIKDGLEAIWVIGRLIELFRLEIPPEEERPEKGMMAFGFVAAELSNDDVVGYPFECSDYYGRTNLTFSQSFTDGALKQAIAHDFWHLIVSNDRASDYESETFHLGGGFMMRYGIRDGQIFYEEDAG
jgi:hypothetical protein